MKGQVVGFALTRGLTDEAEARAVGAIDRTLAHFPWLARHTTVCGDTTIHCWGHGCVETCLRTTEAGSVQALFGSAHGCPSWQDVDDHALVMDRSPERWQLPWDGRCIFWQIDPQTGRWQSWNDWCGGQPVYHASTSTGTIASSLEPVVAAAVSAGPETILPRGLYSLLSIGHFFGADTLFENVHWLPADVYACWQGQSFRTSRLESVIPSDSRWGRDLDTLADEAHELIRQAVGACCSNGSPWTVPLSGGLDSRTIAAVGSELGIPMTTCTYGNYWNEAGYAQQVARALDLPWSHHKLTDTYCGDFASLWGDWFGCSMFFHGMYQMPFLTSLPPEPDSPIVDGFVGGTNSGGNLPEYDRLRNAGDDWDRYRGLMPIWEHDDLERLLRRPCGQLRQELCSMLRGLYNSAGGAEYQELMMIDLQHRQRAYIFYHPMMYSYFRPSASPLMGREYSRFCLSLPKDALYDRDFVKRMLVRHFPQVSKGIRGTFALPRMTHTPGYLLLRSIATLLPKRLRLGPLREWNPRPCCHTTECFVKYPQQSLWPISDVGEALDGLLDGRVVLEAIREATTGTRTHHSWRISAVQAVAMAFAR